ncbi:hypothetical protein C8J57DRAFT_1613186 [Mycena rebaudengoi]|nr:hypothetical protein C8J57DRAFT_1613186 [Mycena rebaudengoi]
MLGALWNRVFSRKDSNVNPPPGPPLQRPLKYRNPDAWHVYLQRSCRGIQPQYYPQQYPQPLPQFQIQAQPYPVMQFPAPLPVYGHLMILIKLVHISHQCPASNTIGSQTTLNIKIYIHISGLLPNLLLSCHKFRPPLPCLIILIPSFLFTSLRRLLFLELLLKLRTVKSGLRKLMIGPLEIFAANVFRALRSGNGRKTNGYGVQRAPYSMTDIRRRFSTMPLFAALSPEAQQAERRQLVLEAQKAVVGCDIHFWRSSTRIKKSQVLVPPTSTDTFEKHLREMLSPDTTSDRFDDVVQTLKSTFPLIRNWVNWWLPYSGSGAGGKGSVNVESDRTPSLSPSPRCGKGSGLTSRS